MKQVLLLVAVFLAAPILARGQDAATEEQLNKLRSQVTELQASNVDLQKRLAETLKEMQELRSQMARPSGNYASAEDLKTLADAIKEVDRKRTADVELILRKLQDIKLPSSARNPDRTPSGDPTGPRNGYEYVVKSGDTLSGIVDAYRKNNIKVTVDAVLKANPGLKPSNLKVGQTIFIPEAAK